MRTGAGRATRAVGGMSGMSGMGSVGGEIPMPLFLDEENQRLQRELEDCDQRQQGHLADMRGRRMGPACKEMQEELKEWKQKYLKSQVDEQQWRDMFIAKNDKVMGLESRIRDQEQELALSAGREAALQAQENQCQKEKAIYEAQIKLLEASVSRYEQPSGDSNEQKIKQREQDLREKGTEIARLTADVAEKSRRLSQLQVSYDELSQNASQLEVENNVLRAEKKDLEDDVEKKDQALEELQTEYDNAVHEKQALDDELQDLKKKMVKCEQDLKELTAKLDNSLKQVQTLETSNSQLADENFKYEARLKKSAQDMREFKAAFKDKLSNLNEKIEKQNNEFTEYEMSLQQMREIQNKVEMENDRLKQTLQRVNADAHKLPTDIEHLAGEWKNLAVHIQELGNELKAAEGDDRGVGVQANIRDLARELKGLPTDISQILGECERQLSSFQEENSRLQAEKALSASEAQQKDTQLNEARTQITALKAKINDNVQKFKTQSIEQLEVFREQMEQYELEKETLNADIERVLRAKDAELVASSEPEKQAAIEQLNESITELEQKKTELERQLNLSWNEKRSKDEKDLQSMVELRLAKEAAEELQSAKKDLEQQLQISNTTLAKNKTLIADRDNEIVTLKENASAVQQQYTDNIVRSNEKIEVFVNMFTTPPVWIDNRAKLQMVLTVYPAIEAAVRKYLGFFAQQKLGQNPAAFKTWQSKSTQKTVMQIYDELNKKPKR